MRLKALAIASCLGLLAVAFLPSSKADEWNKKTILTVNEPLMIPGKVLEPGKYVIKLMDSQSNRHIVQVFNENESKLETTILAIPNYRLEPTGQTQFGFWEMPAGQPRALKAWFYPGDNFGQEFAYPKDVAAQIAQANNQNVPAVVSNEQNLSQAEVREVTPSGQEQPMSAQQQAQGESTSSQATTSPSSQSQTPENERQGSVRTGTGVESTAQPSEATAQSQSAQPQSQTAEPQTQTAQPQTGVSGAAGANEQLPRTASPFPLIGLGGLLSLGLGAAARVARRKA